jgi:hypothetical protein
MDLRDEREDQRIEREAAALELESRGEAIITVSKALLGMELILVCFVDIGLRTGSRLFLWWVIAEALLGVVLAATGMHHKAEAKRRLSVLEPL